MTQRLLTLFGHLEEDGTLTKATFPQAYELAIGKLLNQSTPEQYNLLHDRAVRRFAREQLLGEDRGYFLHKAGVALHKNPGAEQFAALAFAEIQDTLYAQDPNPVAFARELDRLMLNMAVQPEGRVPVENELLLDHEIEVRPLRA